MIDASVNSLRLDYSKYLLTSTENEARLRLAASSQAAYIQILSGSVGLFRFIVRTCSRPRDSIVCFERLSFILEKAVAKLWNLGLVYRIRDKRALWMHDLTRRFVGQTISPTDYQQWLLTTIGVLYHTFPERDDRLSERSIVDSFLPQAIKLVNEARRSGIDIQVYVKLIAMCAHCLHSRGSYAQALEWYQLARPIFETYLGLSDRRTLNLLHRIAATYYESGNLNLCEQTLREVLQMQEQSLGSNDQDTLKSISNLASAIERQGRLKEAEAYFQKAYQQQSTNLGLVHKRLLPMPTTLRIALQTRVAWARRLHCTKSH